MPVGEVASIAAKAAVATPVIAGLGAAGDDRVGVAGADHPRGVADRVGAGRAGRDDAVAVARGGRGASRPRRRRRCPSSAAPPAARPPSGRCSISLRLLAPRARTRPPIPVPITQPTRSRLVRQLPVLAAGLADRLVGGGDRHLREAVGAPRLLLREEVERLELAAAADAVLDPALAGDPALDQRLRADPERGDGADAGDDDPAASSRPSPPPGR